MVQFNFSERTIKAKVVYYGPAQSGKTTNLEQIHRITDPEGANRLISLNTAQDRTLFFDLLPFSLGTVSGYDFKIQLYTVPGQVQYNATRRVVLAGADAVVFVADSQKTMARENLSAFENMKVNLLANRLVPEKVPLVLQYNKQDLPGLIPRPEIDRAINFWGRKAFPAVAARGEGVMETFVAIVQDMLTAIAVKYNLKEKGLDPDAVPEIVAHAFQALLQRAPAAPGSPPTPSVLPPRVVISQPDGAEPAYPGQVGPDVSPVSEELLHRAIRSNVELAEVLGQFVHDVGGGLALIHGRAEAIANTADPAARAASAAIRQETERLRRVMLELGQAASKAGSAPRAPLPSVQAAPSAPAAAPASGPPLAEPAPPGTARPPSAPGGAAVPAAQAVSPAHPAALPAPVALPGATLDALLAEVASTLQRALAARPVTVENRVARATALPRCSPAGLRRALSGFLQGLAAVVTPASSIAVRAERKPVLLRGRDGTEVKRDFLMVALTHAAGLVDVDQQRVLKLQDPGPLGQGHKAVRELGGFLRFAPLPGGALETRLFLPL